MEREERKDKCMKPQWSFLYYVSPCPRVSVGVFQHSRYAPYRVLVTARPQGITEERSALLLPPQCMGCMEGRGCGMEAPAL